MRTLQSWLALGRISNLPTVWANCLGGWVLAGLPGQSISGPGIALTLGAATCLYTAGMFLNDAWDANWDAAHRPQRPIPSGLISRRAATIAGILLLALGCVLAGAAGITALLFALGLTAAIGLYTCTHKRWAGSFLIMAACRGLIYPMSVAAVISEGAQAPAVWAAAGILASYVALISIAAAHETSGQALPVRFRIIVLIVPAGAAWLLHGNFIWVATYCLLQLILWSIEQKRKCFGPGQIGRLIACMPLVDLMVSNPPAGAIPIAFLILAIATLSLQRKIHGS